MTTYLDPRQYCNNVDLSDVLILYPSYRGPDPRAAGCIQLLAELGATLCVSYGLSDIAMHRCIVAGRGYRMLHANDALKYVLWLDDDMLATGAHVSFIRACVVASSRACTAYYCKRGYPRELAMRRVPEVPASLLSVAFSPDDILTFNVEPTLCGLGFLMLSREQFMQHCDAVPHVGDTAETTVPVVCSSGPVKVTHWNDADATRLTWFSEDISYCDGLWQLVRGVVAVPIAVAHLSSLALLPAPDAAWLA
jgi:hypothetical protein